MPLQLAIHCHPKGGAANTSGADDLNLALKLEQIASLLTEMKDGIVKINIPEGETINVDLKGIEDLLGGLLDQVTGKLDAIAETNNAIKISTGEAASLLNQINVTVSGIIGAVNSMSNAVAENFGELFNRWDTIFGMIKSEFDETQLAIKEGTVAQRETTSVLHQIKDQLVNKEVEEISKDIIVDANFEIKNKIDVIIPAGAIAISMYFDYDDCDAVDVDRSAMRLGGERYLATVKQVRKDGSESVKAKITPRVQGAWTGELKSLGSNVNTKLPKTVIRILKSHAVFTIEAIYAKLVAEEIETVEIAAELVQGKMGEEEVADIPVDEDNAAPAEEGAPVEESPVAEEEPAVEEEPAPVEESPVVEEEPAPAEETPGGEDELPAE